MSNVRRARFETMPKGPFKFAFSFILERSHLDQAVVIP
jgi:hypothetical protein